MSALFEPGRIGAARAALQRGHGGGHTRADIRGERPIAPSAVPHQVYEVTMATVVPEAMTTAADRRFAIARRCR